MSSASFVLLINLGLACLFAGLLLWVGQKSPDPRSARWFAASFAVGGFAVAIELFSRGIYTGDALHLFQVAGYAGYILGAMFQTVGIAYRLKSQTQWKFLLAVLVAALVAEQSGMNVRSDGPFQLWVHFLPFALSFGAGAWCAFSQREQVAAIDQLLGGLFALSAVQYFTIPLVTLFVGMPGAEPDAYLSSQFAAWSQMTGSLVAMALGLTVLVAHFLDMLNKKTMESMTDPLTGLLNRRGFDTRIARHVERGGTALAICDIDHFKNVNDSYGHYVGDNLLLAIAELFQSAEATGVIVSRMGGEEFYLLIPRATESSAHLLSEGLRLCVQTIRVTGLPVDHAVTCSFGVAEQLENEPFDQLVKRADAALYRAKQGGRNRVMLASKQDPSEWHHQSYSLPSETGEPKAVLS